MWGAIAGDLIGSIYEHASLKTTAFPLFSARSDFTDDTVLTVATAHALLEETDYAAAYRGFGRRYPDAGYGGWFRRWMWDDEAEGYGSFGNGSAMRVSPIGWAFDEPDAVLRAARLSAEATHGHPEGVKGAQAVALAVLLARTGASKSAIRAELARRFEYDLDRSIESIRPDYHFDVTCQGSVPEALIAFLESSDWEHAVRLAVSLGGDADTQACIAGSVAEAFYGGVPAEILAATRKRLPAHLLEVTDRFRSRFPRRGDFPPGT